MGHNALASLVRYNGLGHVILCPRHTMSEYDETFYLRDETSGEYLWQGSVNDVKARHNHLHYIVFNRS